MSAPLAVNYLFVNGIEPKRVREKELAVSVRKSHAAKVIHQKRRARKSITQSLAMTLYPQPVNDLLSVFSDSFELHTFDWWLKNTSVLISRYTCPFEEIYTRIVPQYALGSSMVRHMLLAHSLRDEINRRAFFCTDVSELEERACFYYSKGVRAMAREGPNSRLLAAAKLGYAYETLNNNDMGATTHLRGFEAIISNHCGQETNDFRYLKDSHECTMSVMSLVVDMTVDPSKYSSEFEDTELSRIMNIETVDHARIAIAMIVEKIATRDPNVDVPIGIRISLSRWFNTLRRWEAAGGYTSTTTALVHLLLLAVSVCSKPSPSRLDAILSSAKRLLHQRHALADLTDFLACVRTFAELWVKFINHEADRALALVNTIEGLEQGIESSEERVEIRYLGT